jgi:FMN phosphatase YigB (HAD superfamily)
LKPQVVFFDIGQTLATGGDLSPRWVLASRLNLSRKETHRVGKRIMTHFSREPSSLAMILQEILLRHDPERIRSTLETVWKEQVNGVREIPGATSLLRSLKAAGIKVGLISNIWHPFYRGFCQNCPEMASLPDHILLSYRAGIKKPSLEFYQRALEISATSASSCWMVGDSYELDMEPAMQVGMRTMWVLSRPEREKSLLAAILRREKPPPHWVAENLNEVFSFFQKALE